MRKLSELTDNELAESLAMLTALQDESTSKYVAKRVKEMLRSLLQIGNGNIDLLSAMRDEIAFRKGYSPNKVLLFIKGFGDWDCVEMNGAIDRDYFVETMGRVYDQMHERAEKQPEPAHD